MTPRLHPWHNLPPPVQARLVEACALVVQALGPGVPFGPHQIDVRADDGPVERWGGILCLPLASTRTLAGLVGTLLLELTRPPPRLRELAPGEHAERLNKAWARLFAQSSAEPLPAPADVSTVLLRSCSTRSL